MTCGTKCKTAVTALVKAAETTMTAAQKTTLEGEIAAYFSATNGRCVLRSTGCVATNTAYTIPITAGSNVKKAAIAVTDLTITCGAKALVAGAAAALSMASMMM